MNYSDASYNQPEKDAVREHVIAHAVNSLTHDRSSSSVVTAQEFDRTMDYCVWFLRKNCNFCLKEDVTSAVKDWHTSHESCVGNKKPKDLAVLFLAGPDPIPDLLAFQAAGVPLKNIWAIESDKATFSKAISVLGREGLSLKVHNGNLQQFFSIVPQQFDIVYFDACAQLFGGKPNTIHVLRELFVNQRLTPLSVLINNFCEPLPKMDPELPARIQRGNHFQNKLELLKELDGGARLDKSDKVNSNPGELSPQEHELLKWGKTIGLWSYANGDNETWTNHFDDFVKAEVVSNLLHHYSRFTTEFVIRFAGQLLPWWRVVALPGSRREYFNNQAALAKAVTESSKVVEAFTHPLYPAFRHARFTEDLIEKHTPLHDFYIKETLGDGMKLAEDVKIVFLIRTFLESEWGNTFFPTQHIRDACSQKLIQVLRTFKWFDDGRRIFCSEPFPHLLVDLLTGLYGYPYHANTRKLYRIAYQAKDTVMFTDAFVFDQARYLYDLLPTLPFFTETFPIPQQLVLRVCMDGIRRHSHFGCDDLFYCSDLAASGEQGFKYWPAPRRKGIGANCPKIEKDDLA